MNRGSDRTEGETMSTPLDEIADGLAGDKPQKYSSPPNPNDVAVPEGMPPWGVDPRVLEINRPGVPAAWYYVEKLPGGSCLRCDPPASWSQRRQDIELEKILQAGWRSITLAEGTLLSVTREDCWRFLPSYLEPIERVPKGWEPPWGGQMPALREDGERGDD